MNIVLHSYQKTSDALFILNTLRPRQNGRHYPYEIPKCTLLNENVLITILPKFVLSGPITNIPALVQIIAWRRPAII